jgi:protein O-GlcNAc transferase
MTQDHSPGDSESEAEIEKSLLKVLSDGEKAVTEARIELAHFYQRVGRPQKAAAHLEFVLPPTGDLEQRALQYLHKGQLMEQEKDYRMAMAFYVQALPLEPTNPRVWYLVNNNLGYCLNHFKEFTRAEEYCRAAIRVNSDRHNAHKNLGISLEGQGCLLDAIACYVRAIERQPRDARALKCLEDLLDRHLYLLIENPELSEVVAECQKVVSEAMK